jgi:hypothetical protein
VRMWCTAQGGAGLMGRAVDRAAAAPFRPLVEALLGALRRGPIDDDRDVAPFRAALAHLVPEVAGVSAPGPPPPLLHVAEGFLRVARARTGDGHGTAVLLDDLHWADAETLAVVEYLADNIGDEPILLVVAARPVDCDAVAVLSSLADRRVATRLELPRLGPEATAEMARSCLGDAAVPAQVLQLVDDRADGLPFLVEELLAGLRAEGALVRQGDRWVVNGVPARRPRRPSTSRCAAACARCTSSTGGSCGPPHSSAGPSTPRWSRRSPPPGRPLWTPRSGPRRRSPSCRTPTSASASGTR